MRSNVWWNQLLSNYNLHVNESQSVYLFSLLAMADRYSKYIAIGLMTAKYISIDIRSFGLKRLTIQDSEINSSVSCVKSISLKQFTNTLNYMTTGSGMGILLASTHSSFLCYLDFVSQPVFKIHTQCLLSYTRFSSSQTNICNRYW